MLIIAVGGGGADEVAAIDMRTDGPDTLGADGIGADGTGIGPDTRDDCTGIGIIAVVWRETMRLQTAHSTPVYVRGGPPPRAIMRSTGGSLRTIESATANVASCACSTSLVSKNKTTTMTNHHFVKLLLLHVVEHLLNVLDVRLDGADLGRDGIARRVGVRHQV